MSGNQYLLLLPPGSDRHRFLQTYDKPLKDLGYISYPWSPAINGYPMRLKYKVWIELKRMSPQAWTIDHLVAVASSFGLVLEHASMTKVASLERMFAVVAVPDLSHIPRSLLVWIRGIAREIEVLVHSWIEEPLLLIPPIDTTPNDDFFNQVHLDNVKAVSVYTGDSQGKSIVAINYDTLFAVWDHLDPGPRKDKLEETLKATPYFLASRQATGGPSLPAVVQEPVMEGAPPPCQKILKGKGIIQISPRDTSIAGTKGVQGGIRI